MIATLLGDRPAVTLGVCDRDLALIEEPQIADYLELHLRSLRPEDVRRLAESGWAGRTPIASGLVGSDFGALLSAPLRRRVVLEIRQRIDMATALAVKCLVLGGGRARSMPADLLPAQAQTALRSLLVDLMPALEAADSCLMIEPLNRAETNFIHTLREAFEIIYDLPEGRFGLTYDVYHHRLSGQRWADQEEAAVDRVGVIHLASRTRGLPRPVADRWLSRELVDIHSSGFRGYVSIEVNTKELDDRDGLAASLDEIRQILS